MASLRLEPIVTLCRAYDKDNNYVGLRDSMGQIVEVGIGSGDASTDGPLSQFAATTSLQLRGVITDPTGTGNLVFAQSPHLISPDLGTPSSLNLANAIGLPASGITGMATGMSTFLATPSSANLKATVTDETGSGNLVFGTSPQLVTPDLGVPSTLVLTNATGLPIATGVTGMGTGVATFLATPSAANFAAAITGETGTGAPVFGTGPTVSAANLTGIVTTDGANVTTANAMSALAIDVTKGLNTKTVAVDSTFTFSGTPATANQWFSAHVTNSDTAAHILTFPNSFSLVTQAARTTCPIAASGQLWLMWRYDGSTYHVFGDSSYLNQFSPLSPTNTDDITEGYGPGSFWGNRTTGVLYWCESNTAGAAVWNSGGTGSSVAVVDNLTTTDSTAALSANQGVILQTEFDALLTQFQQLVDGGAVTTTNDSVQTLEDTALTGNVLDNDTTTSGTLSVSQYTVAGINGIKTVPSNTVITNVGTIGIAANGDYSFTPVANYHGVVPTITYQCTNGTDIATGNLIITVVSVNDPPIAGNDTFGATQGVATTLNVLANDADIDADTLTLTQINGVAIAVGGTATVQGGTVVLNANKTLTYTPGGSVTGSQAFSYTISDGKGGTSVATVTVNVTTGGGSVATPIIVQTDARTGPTTGGEFGAGCYLTILGKNFGQQSDLSTNTKVYIGGVEVANYRYLVNAVTYPKTGLQAIGVQVGSLGGAANGTALAVTVVRNGSVTSNNDHTFTPCAGQILFASLAGNDQTAVPGDISKPYRHLQATYNGYGNVVLSGAAGGIANVQGPGDHIVIAAGNWTDAIGLSCTWYRFRYPSQQGTALRNVHFTAHPGAILAHAPNVVAYTTPGGTPPTGKEADGSGPFPVPAFKGGIQGTGDNYSGTTGDYVSISNLHLMASATSASDAAPINMQYSIAGWKATNCEIGPWPSSIVALAAGISGHAKNSQFYGNYIHDIGGDPGTLTNHGMYCDTYGSDWDVGYNWITNITGGNCVQQFDSSGGQGTNGWVGFTNMKYHHNWLDGCGKYGWNMADGTISFQLWNNVTINCNFSPVRYNLQNGALDGDVFENTFWNNCKVASGSGNGAVLLTHIGGSETGTLRHRNNIFMCGPNTVAGMLPLDDSGGGSFITFAGNLWYGHTQTTPWTSANYSASVDATGGGAIWDQDPLFTAAATGDFTLQAASPAIDVATATLPFTLTDDFRATISRPQGSARDIGAYERNSTLPFPTAAPTFGGTEQVGATSTVSQGTWGNGPITQYAYQWFTAPTNGGTITFITGETASSHTWTVGEQDKYGGCKVTATNAAGSSSTSVFIGTAVLANASAPVNTVQPSITGTAGIGNVLTRVAGTWTPNSGADAAVLTWNWMRNAVPISGATGATYTQVTADDSTVITIQETGSNQWGSHTVISSNSKTVPHVSAAPALVGTAVTFATATSTTAARAVQANDVVAVFMSGFNNAPHNMTITDSFGGNDASWNITGENTGNTPAGAWRYKKVTTTGTITLTINAQGGSTCGLVFVLRGVDTSTALDGASVANFGTTSPRSGTPSTTSFGTDLILAGNSSLKDATNHLTAYSDTFVSSMDDPSVSTTQVVVQKRITSSAGAQSAMTFTSTGSNKSSVVSIVNFRGF